MPGKVVATKRTPDNAGSAITRSNDRAALAPPGNARLPAGTADRRASVALVHGTSRACPLGSGQGYPTVAVVHRHRHRAASEFQALERQVGHG